MTRERTSICLNCGSNEKRPVALFCDNKCHQEFLYKEYIRRWKEGLETGIMGGCRLSQYIRRYMLEKGGNKCSKCGWCEVNPITGKVPITINHVNGKWFDCAEENLEVLCPNCHSLTPTYCALNWGNGRTRG